MPDVVPPLPAPSGGGGSPGSAELADDLLKGLSPAAPEPPAPAAPAAPTPKEPAAPAAPAGKEPAKEPPKEPAKPAAAPAPKDIDPDDQKITAAELRKELKRIKEHGATTVREKETQLSQLREQLNSFERRRYWTDDDLKASEAATKRLAQLESELYSRDFAASPEYKSKYQDRFDEIWKEASEEVQGLTVRYQDGVDEEQKPKFAERPATVKDLLAVVDAPIRDRLSIANKLFGENKEVVLGWARDIAQIRKDAARAIEEKRNGYTTELTKRNQQFQEANQKIAGFIQQTNQHLAKNYPDIFEATPDQPEAAEALKKGFAFVDESSAKMMEWDINTRAARASVVRAMAGAFPRLLSDRVRDRAEIKSLREKLAKFEKSDPSEMGGTPGSSGGGRTEKGGGSDELAAELEAQLSKS
jgi:hypothetical protein